MAWAALVVFAVGVAGAFAQFLPGGYGETRYVDAHVRQVVFSVKVDIVSRLNDMGVRLNDFQPILYRGRAAAGTGYLVKIRIDYDHYIHVSLFQHLSGAPTEVLNIEVGKSWMDPLE